jgi:hypothetical protein
LIEQKNIENKSTVIFGAHSPQLYVNDVKVVEKLFTTLNRDMNKHEFMKLAGRPMIGRGLLLS